MSAAIPNSKTGWYAVQLGKRLCAVCGRPATHEVFNRYNANVGLYCPTHARAVLKKSEPTP